MITAQAVESNVPRRSPPRMIEVVGLEQPHPEIKRVIFSGKGLIGFPSDKNGAHIKLFFPKSHQSEPILPVLSVKGPVWPSAPDRPITRTYSVRYYDAATNTLAVDFVWHTPTPEQYKHHHSGPAQKWLSQVHPGQRIGLAGPGGPDPLIYPAENQIFVGDTSALAAIWALTENASTSYRQVFLVSDHRANFFSPRISTHYFRPADYGSRGELYQTLRSELCRELQHSLITPTSDLSAFVAGENALVLNIRDFFKHAYSLRKQRLYAIPYWRLGQDEEAYHQRRHQIMDEVY